MRKTSIPSYKDREDNRPILYDARGVKVKRSPLSGGFLRTLVLFIIPYLIINGIIFYIVTAAPKISVNVADTDNYSDTEVSFSINSLLPIKELEVSMESEPIYYEKNGSKYKCVVAKNGTLFIQATGLNGMTKASYTDIGMLDDTPPTIDEFNCHIENGEMTFYITDTQSGVNYDTIYGVYDGDKNVLPTKIDRTLGAVTIPMETEMVEIHFSDMVGNERTGIITAKTVMAAQQEEE